MSASSKDSSSGCWATYGWTHWICGQSAREQDESEGWRNGLEQSLLQDSTAQVDLAPRAL